MKLSDLREMTYRAGPSPEYDKKSIKTSQENFLKNGKEITKAEGGKYSILSLEDYYGLKRNTDNSILGWIKFTNRTLFNKKYLNLDGIFLVPEFRKTVALSIFLNAIKEIIDKPILIDDAIFDDGVNLLKTLVRRELFSISTINKKTGKISDYNEKKIDNLNNAFIIENKSGTLFKDEILPGDKNVHRFYFTLFD